MIVRTRLSSLVFILLAVAVALAAVPAGASDFAFSGWQMADAGGVVNLPIRLSTLADPTVFDYMPARTSDWYDCPSVTQINWYTSSSCTAYLQAYYKYFRTYLYVSGAMAGQTIYVRADGHIDDAVNVVVNGTDTGQLLHGLALPGSRQADITSYLNLGQVNEILFRFADTAAIQRGITQVSIRTGTGIIAAADYPGYELVQTLWVPATSSAGAWSAPLESGADYKIEASGYFTAGYWYWNYSLPFYADAVYMSTGPIGGSPEQQWNPYAKGPSGLGGVFLSIDAVAPDWGPYDASHVYTVDWVGAGVPIHLWNSDNNYGDNAGGLTVSIYRWVFVNHPPVAQCQNVTVPAGPDCKANASVDNGSYDPDSDPITITQTPAGPYSLGTTSVTLTACDDKGACSSCAATVTVADTTPPAITCTDSAIVVGANCSAPCPVVATATDSCGSVTVTQSPAAGDPLPLGVNAVTATATDAAGNVSTCTATVRVVCQFGGFQQPVNADGSSVFNLGRTVPLKFQCFASDGSVLSPPCLGASLQLFKVTDAILGTQEEVTFDDSGQANDSGMAFRFADNEFIYNLSTKTLTAGTYVARANCSDGTSHDVRFSLNKK